MNVMSGGTEDAGPGPLGALAQAYAAFTRDVTNLTEDQSWAPSRCVGWAARDLVLRPRLLGCGYAHYAIAGPGGGAASARWRRSSRAAGVRPRSRALGESGLHASAIGLGCMGLSQGYGPADDGESLATIHRALDLGVSLLDTAMSYGAGHSEQLLGRAITTRREEVVLATKFGIVRGADGVRLDGRPEHVNGYCDASLSRLGVEVIDLYYLHRVDPEVPLEETVGAMADLVAAGKVRHLGLSEVSPDQLEQAAAVHPIAVVQFEWSLFWREPEDDVIPAARRLGIGLVPYSPLGRGMLTGALPTDGFAVGDFRAADPRFAGTELARNLEVVDAVHRLASELGATSGQLALAWLLAQGPDVVPIPGTRRAKRMSENAAALALELSAADLARLDRTAPRAAWAGDRQSFASHGTTRL